MLVQISKNDIRLTAKLKSEIEKARDEIRSSCKQKTCNLFKVSIQFLKNDKWKIVQIEALCQNGIYYSKQTSKDIIISLSNATIQIKEQMGKR